MPDKLASYRHKRNFKRTAEPSGAQTAGSEEFHYVMHKHAASHDHFDLRLEYAGVLRSWALPKGPSLAPGEKRLAVEVEDHPLEYGDFEGVIPEDEYGGDTVMLWDRGSWQPLEKPKADRLDFQLHGEVLTGHWTLVRIRDKKEPGRKSAKQWLLIKRTDEARSLFAGAPSPDDRSVKSGRTMEQIAKGAAFAVTLPANPTDIPGSRKAKLPAELPVQLATLRNTPPEGNQWIHEIKFDGYRLLAKISKGGLSTGPTTHLDKNQVYAPG